MNEYPPSSPSCRSLTRTAHHPEDRLVTTLFYLPTYLSTYLTLSLSLSLSLSMYPARILTIVGARILQLFSLVN